MKTATELPAETLRKSQGQFQSFIERHRLWIPVLIGALFFGALFWAKTKDPYKRVWFTLKTERGAKVKGVAVLPKPIRPVPVIIYLHGHDGSVLNSGTGLRQMAELGMAAVDIDYAQTDPAFFAQQFSTLLEYIRNQSWAQTNAIAWVGYDLGAERLLSFATQETNQQPPLIVAVSAGYPALLQSLEKTNHTATLPFSSRLLLLHGESDEVVSGQEAQRFSAYCTSNHIQAELKLLPGQRHDFEPNTTLLFRTIGEYCLTHLSGETAFQHYHSIASWDEESPSLLWFWSPAFIWILFWVYTRRQSWQRQSPSQPLTKIEVGLRWAAWILASLAAIQSAIHLIPPRLKISDTTLNIARRSLLAPKWREDFETLARSNYWRNHQLKTLLTHVELANYNCYELINWKLDKAIYNQFVLSPIITSEEDQELGWRRPLWESFYPRIRKENTTEAAAQIIVRHLRERVTIASGSPDLPGIESIWKRQITNEKGFETIYVAAMRSCGVPARLDVKQRAEFWTGEKWLSAPRPLIESWVGQK